MTSRQRGGGRGLRNSSPSISSATLCSGAARTSAYVALAGALTMTSLYRTTSWWRIGFLQRRQLRELFPRPTVEHAAALVAFHAAPTLEVEGHALRLALALDRLHPFGFHRARAGTALSRDGDP